ncbi:hypothetical protein TB1_017923 [Malus domestica]
MKQLKDEVRARLIDAIKPAANKGGKKKSSLPACEPLTEKKQKTYSAGHGGSSAAEKLVIDLTSPKGTKKSVEFELAKLAASKVTTFIDERISHWKGSAVPPMFGFMLKLASRAKSGSVSERFASINSGKVDYAAKMASGPVPHFVATNSSAEKGKSARRGNCERSTESEPGEFPKVCALLQANLLEDVDAWAKFVDSVRTVVVCSNSFVKCPTYSRKSSLLATMHKTLILVAESMRVHQDAIKCAKEATVTLMAQLCSAIEKIEKLEYELVVLKDLMSLPLLLCSWRPLIRRSPI